MCVLDFPRSSLRQFAKLVRLLTWVFFFRLPTRISLIFFDRQIKNVTDVYWALCGLEHNEKKRWKFVCGVICSRYRPRFVLKSRVLIGNVLFGSLCRCLRLCNRCKSTNLIYRKRWNSWNIGKRWRNSFGPRPPLRRNAVNGGGDVKSGSRSVDRTETPRSSTSQEASTLI